MARAGAVWVDVIPSLGNFNRVLRTGMAVNMTSLGRAAGKSYGGAMSAEVQRSASTSAAAVERASAKVALAQDKVAAAESRVASATGRVRVSQLQLSELQQKGSITASRMAAAEERVAVSQRAQALSAKGAASAAVLLARAQKEALPATGFERLANGVSASGRRVTGTVSGIGKQVLGLGGIFAGFAAVGFLGKSISESADFQKHLMVLVTAGGEAKSNLGLVSKGIQDLAVSTGTSLTQLTEGMYIMEKAGLRGADGLTVLKAAAQGAKDENADLGTVTNALTSVMRSYNLPASKANMVMNEMVVAAGASKTTMQDFSGSLSTVLPVASAAGINFAQVGGALATLTSHGTSASEATQELAFTIRNLQAPNNVATQTMAQFGINAQDVSTKLGQRGLTGTIGYLSSTVLKQMGPSGAMLLNTFNRSKVAANDAQQMFLKLPPAAQKVAKGYRDGTLSLADFRAAVKGLTGPNAALVSQWSTSENKSKGFNQQLRSGNSASLTYVAAMKKIMGGANGLNTALQLTGGSAATFQRNVADIGAASKHTGSDIAAWGMAQKTFNVQLDRFKQSVAVAGVTIGTALLPSLTRLASWFANTIPKMIAFVSANQKWIKPLAIGLGIVAGALVAVTVATGALNAVMAVNPVVLVIAGIAALAVGLIYAYKHFETFRNVVNKVWNSFRDTVGGVAAWFTGKIVPSFMGAVNNIKTAFWSVFSWIRSHWVLVASLIGGPIAAAAIQVALHWSQIRGAVVGGAAAVVGWVRSHWVLLASLIGGPIAAAAIQVALHWSQIRSGAVAAWGWITGAVKTGVRGVVAAYHGIIGAGQAVAGWFVTGWNGIVSAAHAVGAAGMWLWRNVFIPVGAGIVAVWRAVYDYFAPTARLIAGIAKWMGNTLYNVGLLIKDLFVFGVVHAFQFMRTMVMDVLHGIAAGATWLWVKALTPLADRVNLIVRSIGGAFVNLYQTYVMPAFRAIAAAFWWLVARTWDMERAVGSAFLRLYQTYIGPTFRAIGAAAQWMWDHVLNPVFSTIRTWVTVTLPAAWNTGKTLIGAAWSALVGGVKAGWDRTGGPLFGMLKTLVTVLFPSWWATGRALVGAAWLALVGGVKAAWDHTGGPLFSAISTLVTVTFPAKWATVKTKVGALWSGLVTGLASVWNLTGGRLFSGIATLITQTIPDKFKAGVRLIASAWDKVKDAAKIPIKFVVNTVLNQGLIGAFNWVASKIGSSAHIANIPLPKGFATGGHITGAGGPTEDRVPIMASPGEFIVKASAAKPHRQLLEAINGGGGSGGPGFAGGGWIGSVWDRVKTVGEDIFSAVTNPASLIKRLMGGMLGGLKKFTGNPLGQLVTDVPTKLIGFAVDKIKSMASGLVGVGGPGSGGPGGAPMSFSPSGGVAQWAPLIGRVLQMLSLNPMLLPRVEKQMSTESGGNPNAVNRWDTNWPAHPSVGLMQVIRGTFDAYAGPYKGVGPFQYGVSTNPLANIYAGLNYASQQYGSNLGYLGQGHGYAEGGWVHAPGGPTADGGLIPASNREFVVKASAAARNGPALEAMNRGDVFGGRQWNILDKQDEAHTHYHFEPKQGTASMADWEAFQSRQQVMDRTGRRR